jgi:4-amino-4-deoxy-L-arabinose transferase-like glycosyltransferase
LRGSRAGLARIILAAILLLAAALRVHRLGTQSYWIDEFFSLQASNGYPFAATWPPAGAVLDPPRRLTQIDGARPLSAIPDALRPDNHAPLYFVLLRGWRMAFGDAEAATRSLSVLASLAGLLLLFDAVRSLHGTEPALWAALLLAVAGPQVRFAQEARPYALAATFVVAAAAALARLERAGPGWLRTAAFGGAALFAMLTHYYAAGALLGLAVHAALDLRARTRRQALLALVGAGISYAALWGSVLLEQRRHVVANNLWVLEQAPDHVARTLARVASLPLQFLVANTFLIRPGLCWAGVAYPILLFLAWRRAGLRLFLFWALGSIGLVTGVDLAFHTRQLEWTRYLVPAAPAFWALFAAIETPRPWRRGVPALAVAIAALALPGAYAPVKTAWSGYARVLDKGAREGELIAVTDDGDGLRYTFQALRHYAWQPRRPYMMLSAPPTARELAILRPRGHFWLLTSERQPGPEILLPGVQVEERVDYSPDLPTLWRLSFAPQPEPTAR